LTWRTKLEANQSDPHKLWKMIDDLLGRGRIPASTAIDVEVFSRFFSEKVATKVRSSTADAPAPTFTRAPPGVSLGQFLPLTTDDVIDAVRRLPDKSSAADPMPTSVLKQTSDLSRHLSLNYLIARCPLVSFRQRSERRSSLQL